MPIANFWSSTTSFRSNVCEYQNWPGISGLICAMRTSYSSTSPKLRPLTGICFWRRSEYIGAARSISAEISWTFSGGVITTAAIRFPNAHVPNLDCLGIVIVIEREDTQLLETGIGLDPDHAGFPRSPGPVSSEIDLFLQMLNYDRFFRVIELLGGPADLFLFLPRRRPGSR